MDLALVRPENDLVLQRIQNLKRCVQAWLHNAPRYAVQNGPQLPLFLQGKPLERKPWLAFWLASGWLLAGFWLGLAPGSGWLLAAGWVWLASGWLLAGF